VASAAAWTVLLAAIPPNKQEFPLGDDWAFTRGAIWFAQGEGIHYSKWASMPQLGQWLWSWPFLHIFPWPQFALRISVVILSWLGLAAFYALLRQNKVSPSAAALSACVLAMNPLYFVLQGTYMTDVPALSFSLIALFCYAQAIGARDVRWLGGAVVFALLGSITRQTMIAAPLAAGVALLKFPEARRDPLWALSAFIPVAACLGASEWFGGRTDIIPMHFSAKPGEVVIRTFVSLHWCGLAVLPLVAMKWRRSSWGVFGAALALLLLMAAYFHYYVKVLPPGGAFPYCGGMFSTWGVFSGGLIPGDRAVLLTQTIRVVITILGCIGGAEILAGLVQTLRAREFTGVLLYFSAIEFLGLLALPALADRYILAVFPGALLLAAASRSPTPAPSAPARLSSAMAAAIYGFISVALLHDWLSWNRARWDLGRQALASLGAQPTDIEGGFEWNGWYATADPNHSHVGSAPFNNKPGLSLPFTRYYFPEVTGRYALAFSPIQHGTIVASNSYIQWLPPDRKEFLLLSHTGE